MQALLYSDWDTLRLTDFPTPNAGLDEVLIKVEAAGICGSELEAVRKHSPRRKPPLILGHEFTGIIEKVGAGAGEWKVGDAVVPNAVIPCGKCPSCLRGQTHLCQNRQLFGMHRPGAFAEYVTAPISTLVRRHAGVSPSQAALTEPLANGVHVANLLADIAPQQVVVLGAGPIGILTMQAIKLRFDAKVALIDRSQPRLEVASRLGAEAVFLPEEHEELKEWMPEDGVEATVDAVGADTTKTLSVTLLRPGGTAVWIGLHENSSIFNAYDLILSERRLLGSYACTQAELAFALELIAQKKVDVQSWVSHFDLADAEHAFQSMLTPGPSDVKGVIEMK